LGLLTVIGLTHTLTLHYQQDYIPTGFEAEVFMGWIFRVSPNQQRQSAEGRNFSYPLRHHRTVFYFNKPTG